MSVTKRPTLDVLTGNSHVIALEQERAPRQRLGGAPINAYVNRWEYKVSM